MNRKRALTAVAVAIILLLIGLAARRGARIRGRIRIVEMGLVGPEVRSLAIGHLPRIGEQLLRFGDGRERQTDRFEARHQFRFAVRFAYDVTNKPSGRRMQMDEIGLFTVENGKIVREEFFYPTEG